MAEAALAPAAPVTVGNRLALGLCFLAATLEGADILSTGLAAPRLAPAFHLNPGQMGVVLSAALVGLMIGAAFGGWLSDRVGRKAVLVGSVVTLGVFSLATTIAPGFAGLVATRLLTGLGLGGAFPALIAIAAEASSSRFRATGVSVMFCGQPIGGMSLGIVVALFGASLGWRGVFYIGGFGPLLLAPLLRAFLPESAAWRGAASAAAPRRDLGHALFAEGRRLPTLLLWAGYLMTLAAVYVINSWLPSLMVARGFTKSEGAALSAIENLGAAIGCLVLARLLDTGRPRTVVTGTYLGMLVSLAALAALHGFAPLAAAGAATGFFLIGGQLVLYALTPAYYPAAIRGAGVGMAVAVGRIGAVGGPLIAGALLSAGYGAVGVIAATTPAVVVAGIAISALLAARGWSNAD
jgi:AAHS family 3-hydroxyphenylpropionic acid transporter